MKKILQIFLFLLISINAYTQSPVTISMTTNCFNSSITVPYVLDVDGKPGYDIATGNFGGLSPVQVSILWSTALNLWSINLGGGTIVYTNSSDTPLPPATGWVAHANINTLGTTCTTGIAPPTLSGGVSGGALPVTLMYFSAQKITEKVTLLWATSIELNNDYFSIERSTDGKTFESIGTLTGTGTTDESQQYKFVDERPENGINYYRLRQIDFDGSEEVHKVISVMIENGRIKIYPNPASNSIQLTLNDAIQTKAIIKLFDTNGRLVQQSTVEPNRIRVEMDISKLLNGMYVLQLWQGRDVKSHRFVKN